MEGNTIIKTKKTTGNPGKAKGRWTSKELDILQTFYPTKDSEWLAGYMKSRTASAVRTKAYHMGLKKTPEFLSQVASENRSLRT